MYVLQDANSKDSQSDRKPSQCQLPKSHILGLFLILMPTTENTTLLTMCCSICLCRGLARGEYVLKWAAPCGSKLVLTAVPLPPSPLTTSLEGSLKMRPVYETLHERTLINLRLLNGMKTTTCKTVKNPKQICSSA